jgi:hypothetical protein
MRSKIYLLAAALTLTAVYYFSIRNDKKQFQEKATESLRERDEDEKLPAAFIEARLKYEFDMLKDPATGKIPNGIFEQEVAFARQMPVRNGEGDRKEMALNSYIPAGPNNAGGRTRAVAYDIRYNGSSNRVILAGCVSGGIMRSVNGGANWSLVTPENDVHSFTTIAQDPRPGSQNTWYAAGGEPYGNSAGDLVGATYMGYGIWKSTDNGATWTKLTLDLTDVPGNTPQGPSLEEFDHAFDFVHRLVVNPANGALFVACHRRLVRSMDGGASFQTVFGNSGNANSANGQTEVVVTSSGKVILGVNGGIPDKNLRGVWVSNSGDLGSFTRIAGGQNLGVDSVADWRANSLGQSSRRIVMALAPSDNNIAYVFYENGLSSDEPEREPEADLFRLDIAGNSYSWSNRSANMPDFPAGDASGSDPLTVQGGYDMVVAVKPDNPNVVFVGGTNLYRSTDGFTTNSNTTWINGYATNFTYSLYNNGHPDIHALAFNPSNANEAICGNDGGIQMSSNISAASVSWSVIPNYQTLQYYYVAMDPEAGRNNFAGGAQDNGTHFRDKLGILPGVQPGDSNNHVRLLGGDGCAVGISKVNVSNQDQFMFGGSQYGNIQRVRLTNGVSFANIRPSNLTTAFPGAVNEFGEFVTNFKLDQDNAEILYYVNFNRLFRTTSASSGAGWLELTGVSAALDPNNGRGIGIRGLAFTRGPYHSGHSLYIGTTNGKILRLDDPRNAPANTAPANITPFGMSGNIQDIAVNPNNDDEVMLAISNYGVTSIWWTNNAKSASPNWKNGEGNLTLPSVRSCMIVVKKDASNNPVTEYYVGTSVGLYSVANLGTKLLANESPVWQREGGDVLNFAVVQSLAYRPTDNVMLIGTHGNGMYYTFLGTTNFIPTQNTAIEPITNDRNFIRSVSPTVSAGKVYWQTGNMIGIKKITIQLHDMSGRLIMQKQTAYQSGDLDLNRLAAGTYVLEIYSDNNRYRHIQKLIRK